MNAACLMLKLIKNCFILQPRSANIFAFIELKVCKKKMLKTLLPVIGFAGGAISLLSKF